MTYGLLVMRMNMAEHESFTQYKESAIAHTLLWIDLVTVCSHRLLLSFIVGYKEIKACKLETDPTKFCLVLTVFYRIKKPCCEKPLDGQVLIS